MHGKLFTDFVAFLQKKLESRQYLTPQEFADDVMLVFDNCCSYNPPGDAIYEAGTYMRKVFQEKWAQLPEEPSPAPSTASEATTANGELETLRFSII